jgi:purine-binding chemotaxis protein CheW
MQENNIPLIVFRLKDNYFSVSSQNVVAIIKEPSITQIPQSSGFIKGIFCYREETFKLVDLRKVFLMKGVNEEYNEFCTLMDQRAADHKNWLKELENSVIEKRQFSLTTDPHKCAFGKWYDNFRKQKDLTLRVTRVLDQFDKPHQTIHNIAHQVEDLVAEENFEEAYKVIEKTRNNELSSMIGLFDEMKDQYKEGNQQLVVVMKEDVSKTAIAVDFVNSVEFLHDIDTSNIDNELINPKNEKIFEGLAKTGDDKMVLKLSDKEIIFGDF